MPEGDTGTPTWKFTQYVSSLPQCFQHSQSFAKHISITAEVRLAILLLSHGLSQAQAPTLFTNICFIVELFADLRF